MSNGHTLDQVVALMQSLNAHEPAIWVIVSSYVPDDELYVVSGADAAQQLGLDPLTCARYPYMRTIVCSAEDQIEKVESAAREVGIIVLPEDDRE